MKRIVPEAKGLSAPALMVTSPELVKPKFDLGTLPTMEWPMTAGESVVLELKEMLARHLVSPLNAPTDSAESVSNPETK